MYHSNGLPISQPNDIPGMSDALDAKLDVGGNGSQLTGLTQSQIGGLTDSLTAVNVAIAAQGVSIGNNTDAIGGLSVRTTTAEGQIVTLQTDLGTLEGTVASQGTAIAGKLDTAGDGSQLTGITQSQVGGLGAALTLKADLNSPGLTGTPTAPTAAGGTSTTQLATTAFCTSAISTYGATVTTALNAKAPINSPNFTGNATFTLVGNGIRLTSLVGITPRLRLDGGDNLVIDSGATGDIYLQLDNNKSIVIGGTTSKVSFFNSSVSSRQTVTGSRAGNAALASLLAALAAYGLITNSTSA